MGILNRFLSVLHDVVYIEYSTMWKCSFALPIHYLDKRSDMIRHHADQFLIINTKTGNLVIFVLFVSIWMTPIHLPVSFFTGIASTLFVVNPVTPSTS